MARPSPLPAGLTAIPLKLVNVFLLHGGADGLTLIDAGYPGDVEAIVAGIARAGHPPGAVTRILLTHAHPDHSGSAAELARRTGATVHASPAEAELLRDGRAVRDGFHATPRPLEWLIYQAFIRGGIRTVEPVEAVPDLVDGATLDIAGGLEVIAAPGHAAGQVCLLWKRHGGVLFAADACGNVGRLTHSPGCEDFARMRQTVRQLARREHRLAVFGHGSPLTDSAARMRRAFGA